MEKLKQYLWQRIVDDLEKSSDEKVKDNLKAFKSRDDLIKYVQFYSNLGFDDMKRISSIGYYIRKNKYHHEPGRLLGDRTKAMPDEIYQKLIKYVGENVGLKQKLALEFEGVEGARGEDTIRIKVDDIDFDNHVVKILNRKRGRWYEIPLNPDLEKELQSFILKNLRLIQLHNGFVFFSENFKQQRDHLSQKYMKNLVYEVLKKLGLNKVYARSNDGRNLYLYSLHSLRGHAATRVDEKSNHDLKRVQELLDHEPGSANTTMLYIERSPEKDLKGII